MELEAPDAVLLDQAAGLLTPALPRNGSMLANGMSTSGLAAAASATSSLGTGAVPVACSASTVKTTAAILRSR